MSDYLTEEQKNIINDDNELIIVTGVPGCGKTLTLVEKVLKLNSNKNNNIQIITRTNSVLTELKDRFKKHNIIFSKINTSNHYISNEGNILISNIDSFIHFQVINNKLNFKDPGNYDKKKIEFLNFLKQKNIKKLNLKDNNDNNKRITHLFIDEAQDLSQIEANAFIEILNKKNIKYCLFGATDQTLTIDQTYRENCMSLLNFLENTKNKKVKQYPLSLCFRCLKSHTKLNNLLLRKCRNNTLFNRLNNIPNLETNKEDDLFKPFLFPNYPFNGSYVTENFNLINNIIETIINEDEDIKLSDFCILVGKINNNNDIINICAKLNKKHDNKFHCFITKGNDKKISINFDVLNKKPSKIDRLNKKNTNHKDKLKQTTLHDFYKSNNNTDNSSISSCNQRIKSLIISINGYKGMDAKCVIYLNLADGSIPRNNTIGEIDELSDYSKLNVLLTRSTKYLFIGINKEYPSRYICNELETIYKEKLVYHSYHRFNNYDLFGIIKENIYNTDKIEDIKKIEQLRNLKTIIDKKKEKELQKNLDINTIEIDYYDYKDIKINLNNYEKIIEYVIDEINYPEIFKKIKREHLKIIKEETLKKINYSNLHTPDNNKLSITDISEDINLPIEESYTIKNESIGNPSKFNEILNSIINGRLGELLIIREYFIKNKNNNFDNIPVFQLLDNIKNKKTHKIDNEEIYSLLMKEKINIHVENNNYLEKLEYICNKLNKHLEDKDNSDKDYESYCNDILELENLENKSRKYFYHKEFEKIFDNVNDFLNFEKKTEDLEPKSLYNIAILYDHLINDKYIYGNFSFINKFNENIDNIIDNVKKLIKNFKQCQFENSISFSYIEKKEKNLKELGYSQKKKEHNNIFDNGYFCSITGISDIISENDKILYEIKTSEKNECSIEWIRQIYLYGILNSINKGVYATVFKEYRIINLYTGKSYIINFDNKLFSKQFINNILEIIFKKYKYKTKLLNNFIKVIFNYKIYCKLMNLKNKKTKEDYEKEEIKNLENTLTLE